MIQNYSDPIVTLNQVYKAQEAGTTPVLGACIIGPNYLVREYEDFGESLRLNSNSENYPLGSNSATVNEFNHTTGLSARELPATESGDAGYTGVKVLVKNAELQYASFSSTAFDFISNSKIDQLSIASDSGTKIIFKGDPNTDTDIYAVGDKVIIELEISNSGSGSLSSSKSIYSQLCQIIGFDKDPSTGYYTKCILSKPVKAPTTAAVKKVSFFKFKDCYVRNDQAVYSNSVLTILGNTKSLEISLVDETAKEYDIYGGAFYAEYKAFSTKYATKYGLVSSVDLAEEELGKISAENPLGIAVAAACKEANGNFVYFVAIDKDPAKCDELSLIKAYTDAAAVVAGVDGIHGIVPCTNNKQVLKALLAYVEEQSAELVPYFKYLYGSADLQDKKLVLENQDCSITSSAGITTIKLTKSGLLTLNEKIGEGDKIIYGNDKEATIKSCDNKDTITTAATISDLIDKVSLYKSLTKASDKVNALIDEKEIYNKRCSIVFADGAMYEGTTSVSNYVVAAALAGLRSASLPHAPLSNVKLTAITCKDNSGITKALSDKLGAYGFWRVGTDLLGNCISKRQLTSAATGDVNYDEQSIVTNIDSICLDLKTTGRSYVGNTNISGALIDILENLLTGKLLSYMKYNDALLGPQLLTGSLISIEQDSVYKDRIYASLEGEPPKPFNRFHITFYMR